MRLFGASLTTAWRVLIDRLLTRANLKRMGLVLESNRCVMCGKMRKVEVMYSSDVE